MIDIKGNEIKVGASAAVVAHGDNHSIVLKTGTVSQIWDDNYAEIQVEGETVLECGVEMPATYGANSEGILIL